MGPAATQGLSTAWRHGILYTLAWTYLALVEMYTGRYLRHWWKYRHLIHSVVGTLVLALTLAGWIIMMNVQGWTCSWDNLHVVSGNISTFLIFAMLAGGYVLLFLQKGVNLDWNTKYITLARKSHAWLSYFIVITVQVAVMSGFNRRVKRPNFGPAAAPWFFTENMLVWGLVLLGGEAYH